MSVYTWDQEKNEWLIRERGISFERVIFLIENNGLLDIVRHPNSAKYPHQRIFIIEIDAYAYLVPFVESEREIFFKTVIPSRKASYQEILRRHMMVSKITKEEKEILASYENEEWESIASEAEIQRYKTAAKETFKKDKRINIRISSKDLELLQERALIEGVPYQTLMSSVLHKFVSGNLVDKTRNKA